MSHLGNEATAGWEINLPAEAQREEAQAWPEYPGAESWPARHGFASQRNGQKVTHIVIHAMWGSFEGSLTWFQSANNPYYTSAHYSVGKTGRVGQSVYEHLAAHHIGIHNGYTIGIEHEDNQQMNSPGWATDVMLQTSAKLVAHLCKKYNIPIDRTHIKGHHEFSGQDHTDPGKHWPWDKYINMVKAYAGGPVRPTETLPDNIKGTALHSLEKLHKLITAKGGTQVMLDLATAIYKYAPQKGIRPEVLTLQSGLETGWGHYTGDTKPYNPAGIKLATASGDEPWDFEVPLTADEGGRMMVNHWCAVLQMEPIGVPHGRYALAKSVYAGKNITKISQLGGGIWAADEGYAAKLTNLLKELGTASPESSLYKVKIPAQQQGAYSVKANADAILAQLKNLGIKATIEGGSGGGTVVTPVKKTPDMNINYGKWAERTKVTARDIATRFKVFADTYPGHGTTGQAWGIDFWVAPLGSRANKNQEAVGDQIQKYVEANWHRLNISYMIWWGWYSESPGVWVKYNPAWYNNPNAAIDWDTQMHMDHVHIQVR